MLLFQEKLQKAFLLRETKQGKCNEEEKLSISIIVCYRFRRYFKGAFSDVRQGRVKATKRKGSVYMLEPQEYCSNKKFLS